MARRRPVFFDLAMIGDSHPDLAFALEQLPDAISFNGTFDEIALELEVMGVASALTVRTNALRAYGLRVAASLGVAPDPDDLILAFQKDNARIARWAAISCARLVNERVGEQPKAMAAIAAAEGFLRGEVRDVEMRFAGRAVYGMANRNPIGTAAYFAAQAAGYTCASKLFMAGRNAAYGMGEIFGMEPSEASVPLVVRVLEDLPGLPVEVSR